MNNLLVKIQARYKALVALLGGVLVYLQGVQATNPNKYVSIVIIALTVLSVHAVPNKAE